MKTAALLVLLSYPFLVGCSGGPAIRRNEVEALLDVQKDAWNRGDLERFVSYYDPTMTFCGGSGVTRGTDNLLENYRRSYPTAKERGVLHFEIEDVRPFGSTALVLGRYRITREHPTSGFFSLIVKRGPDGLQIVHDHTSETVAAKR